MQIGMQMFTLRDFIQTEKDLEYTLARMAEIGYQVVQISGISEYDPKKLRAICDSNGLKIALTHTPAAKIINETEQVIETHNILGCDYIGLGAMDGKYRHQGFVQRFIEEYKEPARKIKEAGKLFMYHNHAFEFEKYEGKTIMEMLAEGFAEDEMGFTLDTYWVQEGGADIYLWLDKLKNRIPCIHLKDMGVVDAKKSMMPVYEGNINFDGILAKLNEINTVKYALVEQDDCRTSPFDCAKVSFDNLIKNGWKA